ncbi:MAG: hypothetical protein LBI61_02365 [Puniceicoccales bacterium]|jgi:tetratricopeptide (TPR) repeat protein|nr:hypothetical protein [Puniceicoccales bacterium]
MQRQKQSDGDILQRAKRAIEENDFAYARFLYEEALSIDPQDTVARAELHRLRDIAPKEDVPFAKLRTACHALGILLNRGLSKHAKVVDAAERLLDINARSKFAFKSMLYAAYGAGYYKLAIFASQKVLELGAEIEDLIIIAKSFLGEKIFDQAAKFAKEATKVDPQNEEAKDVLWKASVERHMNSEVQLVTAGSEKRFVPPKIDANKIFIASHKDEKNDENGSEKRSGERK